MGQSLSKLYVHLIFSTKDREPLLPGTLRGRTHAYLATLLNRAAPRAALDRPFRPLNIET